MLCSIVIRVRNAANDLKACLNSLYEQQLPPSVDLEIIVVDNDSTDASAQVANKFGAIVKFISREDFSWGRALNIGIAHSRGEFVVLLSADVELANSDCLSCMLKPFDDPFIAAIYGRQIPRANAPIDEVVRLAEKFPEQTHMMTVGASPPRTQRGTLRFLSNACAVIRRSAWEKVKFDEDCGGAEEQIWMESLLFCGYYYAYLENALAYHSHNDSFTRAGYRLWELHREQLAQTGKSLSLCGAIYAVGSICKRRFRNIFHAKVVMKNKAAGIVGLPFEVAAFMLSGVLEEMGLERRKVRNLMWR